MSADGFVYFAMIGDLIKIGYARCIAGSMKQHREKTGKAVQLLFAVRPAPEDAAVRMVGKERVFTPRDANEMHQNAIAWLRSELPKYDRCVVIGHHTPSLLSAGGDHYGTEDLDLAYCSNQHALIEANPQIIAWIHGHTHCEERYQVGETKIIANPRGYFPDEQRSRNFDPAAADFTLRQGIAP
jgi:hypothetical protein